MSDSSGSSSGSSKKSSTALHLAEGNYRIDTIAVDDDNRNRMQIALHSVDGNQTRNMYLHIPLDDYEKCSVSIGQIVKAVPTQYGLAFFQEYAQQPFTIVLDENWSRGMAIKKVL